MKHWHVPQSLGTVASYSSPTASQPTRNGQSVLTQRDDMPPDAYHHQQAS